MHLPSRRGFTLVETLIVIGIVSVLLALAIPAIQKVRGAVDRMRCAANLNQIGLALHNYHNDYKRFPPGVIRPKPGEPNPWRTWLVHLLPYCEQGTLWSEANSHWAVQPYPFLNPPHTGFSTPVKLFGCPSDNRVSKPQPTHLSRVAGLTSYLGVVGTDHTTKDGLLYFDSQTSLNSIPDGSNFTAIVGERPPSPDFWFGWWYASVGQAGTATPDALLGAKERNLGGPYSYWCAPGPATFGPGQLRNQCDIFHFWSLHPGGAHFLMAGGNVHFLRYSGDEVLPALATRHGREPVGLE